MNEPLENAISPGEKILWKGKRNKKIITFYLLLSVFITVIIALFFFSQEKVEHGILTDRQTEGHAVSILTLIVGAIISYLIYNQRRQTAYIITDKKTIIRDGWNSNSIYIEHKDVLHIYFNTGFIGRIFEVGTIYIDSGKKISKKLKYNSIRGRNMTPPKSQVVYDVIKKVGNPQKIFKLLQQAIDENKMPSSLGIDAIFKK